MTRTEKHQAAQLLKRAIDKLAVKWEDRTNTGKVTQICFAIQFGRSTQADHDIEPKLQALIKHRLDGAPSLRVWLIDRGIPANGSDDTTFEKLQDARLRWMKALIKEFYPTMERSNEQNRNRQDVRNAGRVPRQVQVSRRQPQPQYLYARWSHDDL